MTEVQKANIRSLQEKGHGYKRIAAELDLPVNSVKSYCRRHPVVEVEDPGMPRCLQCGTPVAQEDHRKQKKFCSDRCRSDWWKEHPDQIKRTKLISYVCPQCGDGFESRNRGRIYCSRRCYAQARSKEVA